MWIKLEINISKNQAKIQHKHLYAGVAGEHPCPLSSAAPHGLRYRWRGHQDAGQVRNFTWWGFNLLNLNFFIIKHEVLRNKLQYWVTIRPIDMSDRFNWGLIDFLKIFCKNTLSVIGFSSGTKSEVVVHYMDDVSCICFFIYLTRHVTFGPNAQMTSLSKMTSKKCIKLLCF